MSVRRRLALRETGSDLCQQSDPAIRDPWLSKRVISTNKQRSRPGQGSAGCVTEILARRTRSLGDAVLLHFGPDQVADVVSARLSWMEAVRLDVVGLPNGSQVHPMAAR